MHGRMKIRADAVEGWRVKVVLGAAAAAKTVYHNQTDNSIGSKPPSSVRCKMS